MPYGGLNISVCRYGSPAFVSLPHFYKADPHYTRLVQGMNPQEDLHEFTMIFEPVRIHNLNNSTIIDLGIISENWNATSRSRPFAGQPFDAICTRNEVKLLIITNKLKTI